MSFIPPWAVMPKWQLKFQDWLTSEKTVQDAIDRMFEQPYKIYAKIEGNAVFIVHDKGPMRTTADHPERFPLSKLRKDQLDKIHEIIRQQQS